MTGFDNDVYIQSYYVLKPWKTSILSPGLHVKLFFPNISRTMVSIVLFIYDAKRYTLHLDVWSSAICEVIISMLPFLCVNIDNERFDNDAYCETIEIVAWPPCWVIFFPRFQSQWYSVRALFC